MRHLWEEEGVEPLKLENTAALDPFPHAQLHSFEAQRPAIAARGLAEAETELAGMLRQGRRVLVAFPHRGEAERTQRLLRKVDAEVVAEVPALAEAPSLRFVVSAARRGFVWRDLGLALLPDVQVFRKRPPRADARLGRALGRSRTCAPATTSSTRTTASAGWSVSRRRRSRESPATTSTSRSAAKTACTSRTSSFPRSAATSARTRARPRCRSSAARPGRT